jgi:hypothetical protein
VILIVSSQGVADQPDEIPVAPEGPRHYCERCARPVGPGKEPDGHRQDGRSLVTARPELALSPPSVLLDEAKYRDVLPRVTLHQIDEKAPKGRILHAAHLALKPPEFERVLLLFIEELCSELNDGVVVARTIEIDVRDDRIFAAQKGLGPEGIGNLHEYSMVTNFVLEKKVDEIAESL